MCSFLCRFLFLDFSPLLLWSFVQIVQKSFGWNVGFAKSSVGTLASLPLFLYNDIIDLENSQGFSEKTEQEEEK